MSVFRPALLGPVLTGAALIAACVGVPAHAQSAAGRGLPTAASALTSVLLPTGDRVEVGTDRSGHRLVDVSLAHRTISSYATVRLGPDTYVLPSIVGPYLQRLLDPALFDVTALARAGTAARVPVRLSYTGSAAPSVPGVTISKAAGGTATGYLTTASAASFGQALQRQYLADAKAGSSARTTLFGNVTRIAAAATAPPGATPHFVQKTLIITALDGTGAPVSDGYLSLLNVDDATKYLGFVEIVDGEARVSVPVGHYAGMFVVDSAFTAHDDHTSRMIPFDDYLVSTNNQHLTLDARRATSALSARTPRAAGVVSQSWEWDRTAAGDTGGSGFAVGGGPGLTLLVAPTAVPPASEGTLNSVASWTLAGFPTSGAPYTYDLAFASAGVPADQAYAVSSAQLAVRYARYHSDGMTHSGQFLRSALFPFQSGSGGFLQPLSVPQARTEYVGGSPGVLWIANLEPDTSLPDPGADLLLDGFRSIPAGTTSAVAWGAGPLVPKTPYLTDGDVKLGFGCPTCRDADQMLVIFDPVSDSTPGHSGSVGVSDDGTPVTRFRVWADSTQLLDETDVIGDQFPVEPGSATYRVVYDVDRRPSYALQSTTTHTDLSFVSAAGSGGRLPAGWLCGLGEACSIPAELQASAQLPVDLAGNAPLGDSTIGLSVNHIQGAPAYPISTASVQVRVGGGTWQTLPRSTTGAGQFRFALHLTDAQRGQPVDLRVTAADSHGGRFEQSTTAAFVVRAS